MTQAGSLPFADEVRRCRAAQLAWGQLAPSQRVKPIRRLRGLLAEFGETLALNVTQDIGRHADEVLATDILPTADACYFLQKRAARVLRPIRVSKSTRPLWLWTASDVVHRRPHGIVGIIGTWNYPIYLNVIQIVHALAAGNGVLWKPSELTPATSKMIFDLFVMAGFPADLFIKLPGDREAGPKLAEAEIDHIVFTGSAEVGRKLARRLGERLISSTLELSGCDAMIVMVNANIDLAVRAAWFGSTINHGQTCMAVRRVLVQEGRYQEFLGRLKVLASHSRSEPLALWVSAEQAERLVREAIEKGAKLLCEGPTPQAENDPPRFPPTVLFDVTPEMSICQEASFAPLLTVMPFGSLADAVKLHQACPYGLSSSIFTAYPSTAEQMAASLEVGSLIINDVIIPTAHPGTPFGGRKDSGWGVTQGDEGLLAMTVPQVVTVRSGTFRPHYDTGEASQATAELARGMLNWSHGKGFRRCWRGLRQIIRGMRSGLGKKKSEE